MTTYILNVNSNMSMEGLHLTGGSLATLEFWGSEKRAERETDGLLITEKENPNKTEKRNCYF